MTFLEGDLLVLVTVFCRLGACFMVMPGLAVSVGEMLDALERTAGSNVRQLVRAEPDEMISKIVAGWPRVFEAKRASELGFTSETVFDEIIQVYIDDELN